MMPGNSTGDRARLSGRHADVFVALDRLVLPRFLVQDIDTLEDWEQAELMYQAISRA